MPPTSKVVMSVLYNHIEFQLMLSFQYSKKIIKSMRKERKKRGPTSKIESIPFVEDSYSVLFFLGITLPCNRCQRKVSDPP